MLRSFGTAVVQSTYLNSPLYQRGLHKVSLKSCCYLFALLSVVALVDSVLMCLWLGSYYSKFNGEQMEHYFRLFELTLDVSRKVELNLIINFDDVTPAGHERDTYLYDITFSVNAALPHTVRTPDKGHNLVTFVPDLKLNDKMTPTQLKKFCLKHRSYIVSADKSLLFCLDTNEDDDDYDYKYTSGKKSTSKQVLKKDIKCKAWIIPLQNLEFSWQFNPINTVPLSTILAPIEMIKSQISALGGLLIFGILWFAYSSFAFTVAFFKVAGYFVVCFIIARLITLCCGSNTSLSFAAKVIIHSTTPTLLLMSLTIFSSVDMLSSTWLPWLYSFMIYSVELYTSKERKQK